MFNERVFVKLVSPGGHVVHNPSPIEAVNLEARGYKIEEEKQESKPAAKTSSKSEK